MKPNAVQFKDPESKPGAKPDSKDDLKSLPLPEVEKRLASSPRASAKPRRRSDWRNMGRTRSRKRKPTCS